MGALFLFLFSIDLLILQPTNVLIEMNTYTHHAKQNQNSTPKQFTVTKLCPQTSGSIKFAKPVYLNSGLLNESTMRYSIKGMLDEECVFTTEENVHISATKEFKEQLEAQGANETYITQAVKEAPYNGTVHYTCTAENFKIINIFLQDWKKGAFVETMAFCNPKLDDAGNAIEGITECTFNNVVHCETNPS